VKNYLERDRKKNEIRKASGVTLDVVVVRVTVGPRKGEATVGHKCSTVIPPQSRALEQEARGMIGIIWNWLQNRSYKSIVHSCCLSFQCSWKENVLKEKKKIR
jgi:hypothetical protein